MTTPSKAEALKAKVDAFPAKPGIYFFKNADGGVVYIGKARRLRDRVRSYFQESDDPKVLAIRAETADVDYALTVSEREAAFLENNFVREAQPKFNLRLKDDKNFPYLQATMDDPFPGLYLRRKVGKEKARWFGPFSPAHEARQTIRLVSKFFGLRTCATAVFRNRKRPCLEYDLHLCTAPCVGRISPSDYRRNVEDAILFLEGRTDRLTAALKERMSAAADAGAYEDAAHWRDVLKAIEQVRIKPALISARLDDQDIFGQAGSGTLQAFYVFVMRKGKVVRSHEFCNEVEAAAPAGESLREALLSFYAGHEIPPKVIVPWKPSDCAALADEWTSRAGRSVDIAVPSRGRNAVLLDMAVKNAERVLSGRDADIAPLLELKAALDLPVLPVRIIGFDVSNTQGVETVASLVAFENGRPWKDGYRKFKIRTVQGPNDAASLEEVLRRHFRRVVKDQAVRPDLVLVDGGKPQLHAAGRALRELGIEDLPLVSLAKREEIVFVQGRRDGIRLERTSSALKLLQRVRDEAHRFAIAFHRQRRSKRAFD